MNASSIIALAALVALAQSATPQPGRVAAIDQPPGEVRFRAVLHLPQQGSLLEPQLRGGRVATPSDWPASLYATYEVVRQRPLGGTVTEVKSCTAVLLGPQVLLTAAHCVPPTGSVTVEFGDGNDPYDGVCAVHPQFVGKPDSSADFALCKLSRPLREPKSFRYETVSLAPMDSLVGEVVLLSGFGCSSNIVGTRGDGKYRVGENTIEETSSAKAPKRARRFYAGQENNNLFTLDDTGAANLCPGDSGGPMFQRAPGAPDFRRRVVAGVNSRVFLRDPKHYGSSLISATGGPDFGAWARGWAVNIAKVPACGITGAIPNCRS